MRCVMSVSTPKPQLRHKRTALILVVGLKPRSLERVVSESVGIDGQSTGFETLRLPSGTTLRLVSTGCLG